METKSDRQMQRDARLRKFLAWQGPDQTGITNHQAVELAKSARVTPEAEKARDDAAKTLAKLLVGRSS